MMKCSPRLDEDLSYLSYSGAVLLGPFYLDAKSLVHQMDFEKNSNRDQLKLNWSAVKFLRGFGLRA